MNGTPLHTVHFDLDDETVDVRIECHGDETSPCHEIPCTRCDEYCVCDDPVPGQSKTCLPLEWIVGEDKVHYAYDGGPVKNVKDGAAIVFEWNGEDWIWKLA